jgi:hypothetical protein
MTSLSSIANQGHRQDDTGMEHHVIMKYSIGQKTCVPAKIDSDTSYFSKYVVNSHIFVIFCQDLPSAYGKIRYFCFLR